jgi:AbrB family looped-hinge helix DNA binding protein
MKAKLSEKGQITIPKKLREQLGVRMGDELDFKIEQGRLVATRVIEQDPLEAVWGTLKLPMSVDAWIDELRGPAEPPLPGELEQ